MQTLDQISMKFETWAIFMSLYGMVCQKDIGSISPYPRGISANPFKVHMQLKVGAINYQGVQNSKECTQYANFHQKSQA